MLLQQRKGELTELGLPLILAGLARLSHNTHVEEQLFPWPGLSADPFLVLGSTKKPDNLTGYCYLVGIPEKPIQIH